MHVTVLHRDLNAETAFTALVLLQILRAPLETIGDSESIAEVVSA